MSTIFALATTPGRSAIAIVRISGSQTRETLDRLAGSVPTARQASLRTLRDPRSRLILDQAIVLWFPAPRSFTGEDQAELHLHGGPAVISATLEALLASGLNFAAPGDFTRRAFENGKMDLLQAEAVADLVDAETQAQHRQALAQLQGASLRVQERWRCQLITIISLTEAAIDFADEMLPHDLLDRARTELIALKQELTAATADQRGERVREGFRVALIGEPNAGKSSLLNALATRDAAIVTEIAGTTRDVIEIPLQIQGYRVILADTAGLRKTTDHIELEGVRRAQAWADDADLRIYVVDQNKSAFASEWLTRIRVGDIIVLNKQDLPRGFAGVTALEWAQLNDIRALGCQAKQGEAGEISDALSDIVIERLSGSELPVTTRARHRTLLNEAVGHLDRALQLELDPELFAEDLRLAARCLERITGRVDAEHVLGRIFDAFCIGK